MGGLSRKGQAKQRKRRGKANQIPRLLQWGLEALSLGYHAGALGYSFLLSIVPMTLFFTTLLRSFPSLLKLNEALVEVEKLFPGVTYKIISQMLNVRSYEYSLVSLALTLIFTSNFVRNLERALFIVTSGSDVLPNGKNSLPKGVATKALSKVRIGRWSLTPISHLIVTLLLSFAFLLSLAIIFLLDIFSVGFLRNLKPLKENVAQVILIALNLAFIYKFLLPFKRRTFRILGVSFTIALVLVVLKYLFLLYSSYWLSHALVYGTMAYLLLLLIWMNLTFSLLLLGARALALRR